MPKISSISSTFLSICTDGLEMMLETMLKKPRWSPTVSEISFKSFGKNNGVSCFYKNAPSLNMRSLYSMHVRPNKKSIIAEVQIFFLLRALLIDAEWGLKEYSSNVFYTTRGHFGYIHTV